MNVVTGPIDWLTSRPILHSLRVRLILLVLLASLPSLGLLFLTASQQQDQAIASSQDDAVRYARLAVVDQQRSSDQIETVLTALSQYPELQGNDPQACSTLLQSLPEASSEPSAAATNTNIRMDNVRYRNLYLIERSGSVDCSARPGGSTTPPSEQFIVDRAYETGQMAVGNFRVDPASGVLLISYALPVERADGGQMRVLLVSLEVFTLTAFARQANLPTDAFISIFNSEGTLLQQFPLVESPMPGQSLLGTPVVSDTLGTGDDTAPTNEDREIDGRAYIWATDQIFTPGVVPGTPRLYVLVGIPEEVIVERASSKFQENLGRLGIAALVAMIAAWIGADLFVTRDSESRKGLIRQYYEAFETGNLELFDEVIGPGYIDRSPSPGQARGLEGLRQNVSMFRAAFPDGVIQARELLADRDKVVARVTMTGTHTADYFGMEPSNVMVTSDGVETFRFVHGLVIESWSLFGPLGPLKPRPEDAVTIPPGRPGFWRRILKRRVMPDATGG